MKVCTRAEAALMKALEIDPNFAEAHAGLAGVSVIRANYTEMEGNRDRTADIRRARIARPSAALEIDPSSAEAPCGAWVWLASRRSTHGSGAELPTRPFTQSRLRRRARLARPEFVVHGAGWTLRSTSCAKHLELDPFFVISRQTFRTWSVSTVHQPHEATGCVPSLRSPSDPTLAFRPKATPGCARPPNVGKTSEALATARLIRQNPTVFPRCGRPTPTPSTCCARARSQGGSYRARLNGCLPEPAV